MIKRVSAKSYIYTVFALIVLITSWEGNRTDAAVADRTIPAQSIRLRILAHSDAPEDQWVKRRIRDEIVSRTSKWASEPKNIDEARQVIRSHLSELDRLVGDVLNRYGFEYDHKVELGIVPFPTKVYADKVYPAGDYEALRVTLGSGKGQNWWCVLFPPLCFIDVTAGEAMAKTSAGQAAAKTPAEGGADTPQSGPQKEVRFFLWDMIKKIVQVIKGLFS